MTGPWEEEEFVQKCVKFACIQTSPNNNTYQYHVLNYVQEQMFGMFSGYFWK